MPEMIFECRSKASLWEGDGLRFSLNWAIARRAKLVLTDALALRRVGGGGHRNPVLPTASLRCGDPPSRITPLSRLAPFPRPDGSLLHADYHAPIPDRARAAGCRTLYPGSRTPVRARKHRPPRGQLQFLNGLLAQVRWVARSRAASPLSTKLWKIACSLGYGARALFTLGQCPS
jgi:hypothetical protein